MDFDFSAHTGTTYVTVFTDFGPDSWMGRFRGYSFHNDRAASREAAMKVLNNMTVAGHPTIITLTSTYFYGNVEHDYSTH